MCLAVKLFSPMLRGACAHAPLAGAMRWLPPAIRAAHPSIGSAGSMRRRGWLLALPRTLPASTMPLSQHQARGVCWCLPPRLGCWLHGDRCTPVLAPCQHRDSKPDATALDVSAVFSCASVSTMLSWAWMLLLLAAPCVGDLGLPSTLVASLTAQLSSSWEARDMRWRRHPGLGCWLRGGIKGGRKWQRAENNVGLPQQPCPTFVGKDTETPSCHSQSPRIPSDCCAPYFKAGGMWASLMHWPWDMRTPSNAGGNKLPCWPGSGPRMVLRRRML